MIRIHRPIGLVLLSLFAGVLPSPGRAQTTEPLPTPAPTPTPLSLVSVADEYGALEKLRRDIARQLANDAVLVEAGSALDTLESTTIPLLERQAAELEARPRLADLLDVDTSARRLEDEVTEIAGRLESDVRSAEKRLDEIAGRRRLWIQLADTAATDAAPSLLTRRIVEAQIVVDELSVSVGGRRDRGLELLDRCVQQRSTINNLQDKLGSEIDRIQRQTLASASQPMWRIELQSPQASARLLRRTAEVDLIRTLEYALAEGLRIILVFVIVLFVGSAVTLLVRRRLENRDPDEDEPELSPVLAHPFSASLLLALAASKLLAPTGPQIVDHLFWALMALPAAHLASTILGAGARLPIALITATVLLWPFRAYIEAVPLLDRVLLLAEDAAGIGAVLLILRRGLVLDRLTGGWRTAVRVLLWLEAAVLAVSFVAGVLGEVGLARLLRDGAVVSLGLAMVLYGVARALLRILTDVLRGPFGAHLRMVRTHVAEVLRAVRGSVIVGAVAAWTWFSLEAFQLTRQLQSAVESLLGAGIEVRWFEVTVGELLYFVAAITGAFLIARVVCFVLDEEFLPRLPLARGVPYMISTSVRYLVLLAGFALAVAALGVDLSKATLLAGAFGVGLGFGLQNVVNNFVSGLILLFERPVRINDVIEVSGTLGEVTRIGIRSSTVRTFVGAEVLVPNADLISKEVTNWTLSRRRRLVEVLVGADYGSDPRRVIEVLTRVAGSHDEIMPDPPPAAYLTGFGDSQLDFRLVCWVAQYGDGYRVASELRLAVAEAFAEAGIEIPFPQQDLHVRGGESIPPGAAPPIGLGETEEQEDR